MSEIDVGWASGERMDITLDTTWARDGEDPPHPVTVVRHPTLDSLLATLFEIPESELGQCGFGGLDSAGEDTPELTHAEISDVHAQRGYWGFADTKESQLHFWRDSGVTLKPGELVAFFAHELSHLWLDGFEVNAPPGSADEENISATVHQELRADRVASIAVNATVLAAAVG
jgi:hypothetical protein